jgi:hypothetical protein
MSDLCENDINVSTLLNSYMLIVLNVEKCIKNINIKLTLEMGVLHIFAPHQFIHI